MPTSAIASRFRNAWRQLPIFRWLFDKRSPLARVPFTHPIRQVAAVLRDGPSILRIRRLCLNFEPLDDENRRAHAWATVEACVRETKTYALHQDGVLHAPLFDIREVDDDPVEGQVVARDWSDAEHFVSDSALVVAGAVFVDVVLWSHGRFVAFYLLLDELPGLDSTVRIPRHRTTPIKDGGP